jgi:uncharacterized membrane protein
MTNSGCLLQPEHPALQLLVSCGPCDLHAMQTAADTPKRRRRWYNPLSIIKSIYIRPRVYLGAAVGVALLSFLPASIPEPVRETTSWCLGAAVYLVLAFRLMRTCQSDRIKLRAGVQDDSGILILGLILLAIFSSFSAIFGLLSEAKAASSHSKMLSIALAGATIFVSWMVMQVAFALHYAHQYYRPNHSVPGINSLDFPKDARPDYWGVFYFSTSIGAASQTPDVNINSKELRRLVTVHAIVAFFFNVAVVALMINLAASLV